VRRNPKRAEVDPTYPRGWGTSDRNGHIGNLSDMQWQWDYGGNKLINKRILVHKDELDEPQRQLGTLVLPADPPPLLNARPEQYSIDEQPVSTRYTMNGQIRVINMPVGQNTFSNRIITTPGNLAP
jgi:hypothetical protein